MPELPEVEIVTRGLQRLQGQVLKTFSVFDPKVSFESQIETKDFIGTENILSIPFRTKNSSCNIYE
jgi:formamidopyrimidine-DNA glycosylase